MTDGRTDGQTDGRTEFSSLYRICVTCSAVIILTYILSRTISKITGQIFAGASGYLNLIRLLGMNP